LRRVILNLAVSLDGYIAGPKGEYDWCFVDEDYGMTDFFKTIDATLMGGKTYRQIVSAGERLYPVKTNYVCTRNPDQPNSQNLVFISDHAAEFVQKLKIESGKNIWLCGGSEIIDILLKADLIDEMMLSIHPLILGGGLPLFKNQDRRISFKLTGCVNYRSGLVQATYERKFSD